ncbi:MAG: ribosome maturation factor RimP [Gammaproteobacteria bacterium]|nr:ribosome maturation factor RimP [Gammaproteobacteria bacterium]MDE2250568.1 ribosome maturation factor RimP [Gammaproteobacteria bacterium]
MLGTLGYELVDLEQSAGHGSGLLRIYIDRPEGVGIEDCEQVSREVSALLDVHDPIPGAYRLEVSTPGLDRVLRTPAHFARFAGARAEVELAAPRDGRRRFTGRLAQVGATGIELSVDGAPLPLAYADIFRARLVPEWPDASGKGRKR